MKQVLNETNQNQLQKVQRPVDNLLVGMFLPQQSRKDKDKVFGVFNGVSLIYSLRIFMTFGLSLKGFWHVPAIGNQLEITRIVWEEVDKPIMLTVRSLRQPQP